MLKCNSGSYLFCSHSVFFVLITKSAPKFTSEPRQAREREPSSFTTTTTTKKRSTVLSPSKIYDRAPPLRQPYLCCPSPLFIDTYRREFALSILRIVDIGGTSSNYCTKKGKENQHTNSTSRIRRRRPKLLHNT